MRGATEPLEGFQSIEIEVGKREFAITYDPASVDAMALKSAVDDTGNPCEVAE